MAVIHELSPHLADLIAAGEVVERPSSVAKELVENAIDAGSTRITVEIENGGITYLRIADNGCGMSAEDAPVAFRRHATSKLRTEEDLNAIGTLGFRGEALAAISSVTRIDLFTRQAGRVRLRVCTCIWKPVRFRHRRKPAVRKAQQSLCATCSSTHRLA